MPPGNDSHDDDSKPINFTPATHFVPPTDKTPQSLFTLGNTQHVGNTSGRFIRHSNQSQVLVYTDGACLNNGQNSPVGGCAIVFKGGTSPEAVKVGVTLFCLEDRSPFGITYPHTSNRAKLHAIIAALQYRVWNREGYNKLVITKDSEYVEKGATKWVTGWVKRGW